MPFDVLLFEIRWRRCALPVTAVREVFALQSVTPVPTAPPAIRGLTEVRGQVVPVVDLGIWLGPGTPRADLLSTRPGEQALLIEAALPSMAASGGGATRAALLVDHVVRLVSVDDAHKRPPPPGPAFVIATVPDVDGPALLLDPGAALDRVRDSVGAMARAA